MTIDLSAKVFAILSALVEERIGLTYALRDRELFAEKVGRRMREAGFESALDYYYYLRYDDAAAPEFAALVDELVVTETYFFREADVLRIVVDEVLLPAVREGRRPRVWSAACASGDEPLTLAMLLADAGALDSVEIVASDLSLRALARAREHGWGARSMRAVAGTTRWLVRDGEVARVDPRIVDAIHWGQLNLLDTARVRSLGSFDVVFARNVFIYFSDATISRVIETLTSVLRPGGRLVVGASESLMRFGTMLECEEKSGVFFYRKKP